MNGKRAKALRRYRAGRLTGADVARLARTELNPAETSPKSKPERKKTRKGLKPTALAARLVR